MHFDRDHWTFDCDPTMTDSEVLAFCRDGCLLLRGVVPDQINPARARLVGRHDTGRAQLRPGRHDAGGDGPHPRQP